MKAPAARIAFRPDRVEVFRGAGLDPAMQPQPWLLQNLDGNHTIRLARRRGISLYLRHRRPKGPRSGIIDMGSRPEVDSIEAVIHRMFEQVIPFNRLIGLKIDSLDPKAPRLRFDMRPELVGNPVRQILHGGVISATLDVVGGLAIALASIAEKGAAATAKQFPNIGTIDLRVDYLRPGRGKHFVATGRVVRLGGRVAVVHMELVNDAGEQIATGSAAYIVG